MENQINNNKTNINQNKSERHSHKKHKSRKARIIKRIILFCLIIGVIFSAAVVLYRPLRVWVKDKINVFVPDKCEYKIYYQNNELVYNFKDLDFDNKDVREIQVGDDRKYLINHSRGFAVGAPRDTEFEIGRASCRERV